MDALSQGSPGLKVLSEEVLDMKLYPLIYKVMAVDASVNPSFYLKWRVPALACCNLKSQLGPQAYKFTRNASPFV